MENTLSLWAEQKFKYKNTNQENDPVYAFQLDYIKPDTEKEIKYLLFNLKLDTNASIFVFTSPKRLLILPWNPLFKQLPQKGTLKQICIEKVHLFVMFASLFRFNICVLKKYFFTNLLDPSTLFALKVPLLLTSATIAIPLLINFEKMLE